MQSSQNFLISIDVVSSKFRNLTCHSHVALKQSRRPSSDIDSLANRIFSGDRVALGQAITLIESTLDTDQQTAAALLEKILPRSGNSLRVGITGVPGVGKSTFIESLGKYLVNKGKKLAVLTIDPSSQLTKGSILGDKTRMEELSKHPSAFIRPSSSSNATGGVAHKTREAMLLCEAAGYNVVIVETVGVGQSETAVSNMVDFFLLLMLAGAGDELQGMKKGIMEIADAIVITKADGSNLKNAIEAQGVYQQALQLFPSSESGWRPTVLTSSSLNGNGVEEIWNVITEHHELLNSKGYIATIRRRQNVSWFHDHFNQLLYKDLQKFDELRLFQKKLEDEVSRSAVSSHSAAIQLLEAYHERLRKKRT
jgi:LAO/AO transport system kinase